MQCYKPIDGWRSKFVNPKTGKRSIVFNADDGFLDMPVTVPCGRCTGCRLAYSREWAIRCVHEAQMHDANAFVTLTYAPENLPKDHSIHKEEIQTFMKNLRRELTLKYGRKYLGKKNGKPQYEPFRKIKYVACGEYGEQNNRPHYHLIIFGYDFPDRYLWSKRNDNLLYRSPLLEKCWKKGHSSVGEVTFESAAYVARYVMKKRKGDPDKKDHHGKTNADYYKLLDPSTGEVFQLEPEFFLMSRRPGIGKTWLEKFKSDTDKDYITVRGEKMALPKYYDNLLAQLDEEDMQKRKAKRKGKIDETDNTMERLEVKEKVKIAQITQLTRDLEVIE